MTNPFRVAAVAAALALSTTVLAVAQDMPAPAAQSAPRAHTGAHRFATAVHSLSLSSDQQARIDQLHQQFKAQQKGIADKNQRRANRKSFHEAVMGVLTPDQRAQLKSMMKQSRASQTQQPNS